MKAGRIFGALLAAGLAVGPAYGQTQPAPEAAPAPALVGPDALAREAAEQARRAQEMGAAAAAVEAEAAAAEQRMGELQGALKAAEAAAEDSRLKLESLVKRGYEAEERLIARRAQHAAAFGAMIALEKTPPAAALLHAGRPADAAMAAGALDGLNEALKADVTAMSDLLDEISALKTQAEAARREALERIEAVRREEAPLKNALGSRRLEGAAAAEEARRLEREAAEQTRLAARMQNAMRAAPAPLANPRRIPAAPPVEAAAMAAPEPPPAPPPPRLYERKPFAPGRDRLRAPLDGARLITRFGQPATDGGGVAPGVVAQAPAGSNVYAPWGGTIEKTLTLASGDALVMRIDESLVVGLMGLGQILRRENDEVAAGELIGRLAPPSETRRNASLFIQIRHNDEPVDPLLWMDGIKER